MRVNARNPTTRIIAVHVSCIFTGESTTINGGVISAAAASTSAMGLIRFPWVMRYFCVIDNVMLTPYRYRPADISLLLEYG